MDRYQAARLRQAEAEKAWHDGDYAAAARNFTLAAEQLEAAWNEERQDGTSPAAAHMRACASEAIKRRDMQDATEAQIDALNASLLRGL
jgi:hypothetical protein